MAYGAKLRSIRLSKEMNLRDLALRTDIDIAYLSRVERETMNPPQDEELLDSINSALELSSTEARSMKDLAAVDNKRMPKDVAQGVAKISGFPLFLGPFQIKI